MRISGRGLAVVVVLAVVTGAVAMWRRPPPRTPATLHRRPVEPVEPSEPVRPLEIAETTAPDAPEATVEVTEWQDHVAQVLGEANGACGAVHELTCQGGACVVAFRPDLNFLRYFRRPQVLLEPLLPRAQRPCGIASRRAEESRELQLYVHEHPNSGRVCTGWLMPGRPRARQRANALCRDVLGRSR